MTYPFFQKAGLVEEIQVELTSRYWTGVEKVFKVFPKAIICLTRDSACTEVTVFLCIFESLEIGIFLSIGARDV